MRQIFEIKIVIEKKKVEEKEFDAQLHNKKIKGGFKPLKVTTKKRQEYDKQAQSLLERMRKKHKDGKRGSRVTDKD